MYAIRSYYVARVAALFRRVDVLADAAPKEDRLARDALELDISRLAATWRGEAVPLTLTEFWMVHTLAKHPGHVKSRDQLMADAKLVVDDVITSYSIHYTKLYECWSGRARSPPRTASSSAGPWPTRASM